MKFWAKVRFKGEKNAEHLIRAFFQNFNPASSIVIRGKEANLEIFFDKPPKEIIEAIYHCEILELNYGKNLTEYKEDENEQVRNDGDSEQLEKISTEGGCIEQNEQANVEDDSFEQNEQVERPKGRRGRPAKKKEAVKEAMPKSELINIPELEEIAKKAESFEHFVKLVAEWLGMDKRQEFFEKLAISASEIDKISWKEVEKALKNNGVIYSQWDKAWSGRQVSEKLKAYSVTILPFLNMIRKYKEYSFKQEVNMSSEVENSTALKLAEDKETPDVEERKTMAIEEDIPKVRVKMECMPEIKVFEEILGSVDKTQPIEDRVRYVLNAMGLDKMSVKEKKQIFEIANTAVRKGRMAFDIIFVETKIPIGETMAARMTFSKFVNDFVKQNGSEEKVKLLEFLLELQNIIMFESEIENFSDFTD